MTTQSTDPDRSRRALDEEGQRLLEALRENPHAPRYTHRCEDYLTSAGLEHVRAFDEQLKTTPIGWQPGSIPEWLNEFVETCFREVPYYREYGSMGENFAAIPTFDREDLAREPWSFVPDSLPIEDMAVYQTSGTTGHPLNILTHPEPLAMYIPLVRAALRHYDVDLEGRKGRVSIVLVCFQKYTWTYASVFPVLNQSGFVKVNLKPDEWNSPEDRIRFLDDCDPEIYTGDPLSFSELMRLPLKTHPKALVSTAMALSPTLRTTLEQHFQCPVLDIYSMNETGPIAVARDDGYLLLHHRLFVEILRPDGTECKPGERGEVVLSGGFNPFLPLLRYRTGDYASLRFQGQHPVLIGLEGRPPVIFRGTGGQFINNIDISNLLKPFGLVQYSVHQSADQAVLIRIRKPVAEVAQVRETLLALFGKDQQLTLEEVEEFPSTSGKVIQYTSDLKQ